MRRWVMLSSVVASLAMAQQGPPRGPPPEALAACNGLSSGAACGFTHHGRNLTGECRAGPNGEALACAPAGMPPGGPGGPGGRGGPPPEAVSACAGSSEGASCSVSFNGHTMTGTCRAPPHGGGSLACAPPRPAPPAEAVSACASASEGASCSVSLGGETLNGTCRSHGGGALACAPPHGGGHRGPPPEALAACASSSAGAACSVNFQGKSLTGTCVAGPEGQALACLPPRPN